MVIEAVDGFVPGAKVYSMGEHLKQGELLDSTANLNAHPTYGTHLVLPGTTLRFTHPNLRNPIDVRLPDYLGIPHRELHIMQ
ncbi:MAG TPA: hypothetical protein VGO47_02680 [Chlamydiales bacterium]|nr:hypothetical protein [Chlamydiales bacterium]